MPQPAETERRPDQGAPAPESRGVDRGGPRIPRVYVPRRELWSRLDAAAAGSLTLLVAPAGSGKTLGVAGWVQRLSSAGVHRRVGVTWVDADRTWDAQRMQVVLEESLPAGGPWVPHEPPGLVVIDDAHLLPASALRVIDMWLNSNPDRMRVLLLSRWDLPVSRLVPQLLGHCTILRGDVLRLDADESAALVRAHSRSPSPEVVELVTAQGQGWCAAVVLLARAVGAAPDAEAAAHRYAESDARVADLVASEVFASLRPRERHLLLSTAHEGIISVGTAAHLSHDAAAGEVLADLEATGLLVTRVADSAANRPPDANRHPDLPDLFPEGSNDRRYSIHPLLAEVVRRRIVVGGVDVARAKSTVTRAVALDVARGETREAFRRLVAVDEPTAAAEQLAASGYGMVIHGRGDEVRNFLARYPQSVEEHPETWFVLGLERWFANDAQGALHWLDRVLNEVPEDVRLGRGYGVQAASARLMRARLGLESMAHAVANGQDFVAEHLSHTPRGALPHLLIELGATQAWLGQVRSAEANLSHAAHLSADLGMPALTASAMTHLAHVFFIDGREHLCRQVAAEALTFIESKPNWHPPTAEHRARLLLQLSAISELPPPGEAERAKVLVGPVHTADVSTRFWQRLNDARAALISGSVIEAERILAIPLGIPQVPAHLRAIMILERGWLAFFAQDRGALRDCVTELESVGYPGEVCFLRGLGADLDGDLRGSSAHFAQSAKQALVLQPPYREMALVCLAQQVDALGHPDPAMGHLRDAVRATESRRNAIPFLGWLRHGTPVPELLERGVQVFPGTWIEELREATRGFAGVTALLSPLIAIAAERNISSLAKAPALSPRERDVLQALARGATYADIASHLILSENTVKTHVSSLYSKLGASRRSEALSEARRFNLI